jgi:cytochrome c551/c552
LKGTRHIVVWALGLLTALNLSATAQAAPVSVRIVPLFDPAAYAGRGAVGLMVPGVGATITRADALASLERGKTQHALLGGRPHGKVIVRPSAAPGSDVTFYVSLPPPGRTANHMRYPVAVVGCGARGLLTSSSTRLDGLISIADIAPAVERLRHHRCDLSPLGSKRADDAAAQLGTLDRRIRHVHDARGWALVAVIVTVLALSVLGPPGVVGCVAAVGASLLLSAIGVEGFWPLVLGIAGLTAAFALLLPLRRFVPFVVSVFLVAFLFVLVFDTRLNSLAVLGARPDGGGRFYGVTNQLETLLLAPVIAAAATRGRGLFVGVGLLALVVVGWSKAGADGGGLVVYATALAVLALRLRTEPLTARRLALAGAGVVVLTFALVGIDAALGGSSHVTHAVGTGPGSLLGDLGRRLHLSYLSVTDSWAKGLEFAAGIAALATIAAFFRRGPTVEAMLVALAVSFLVNDTPVDVAFLGALGCWTLVRWEAVDSRAMRRRTGPVVLFASSLLVLLLAGCGSEGTVRAAPETVVGTLKQEAPGKSIFVAQGCNACHTYTPAAAKGTVGPDLDKLAEYAKKANQPLTAFVTQSIIEPDKYIEKGYPKNVMPKTYGKLPANDVKYLVEFLTKPQG